MQCLSSCGSEFQMRGSKQESKSVQCLRSHGSEFQMRGPSKSVQFLRSCESEFQMRGPSKQIKLKVCKAWGLVGVNSKWGVQRQSKVKKHKTSKWLWAIKDHSRLSSLSWLPPHYLLIWPQCCPCDTVVTRGNAWWIESDASVRDSLLFKVQDLWLKGCKFKYRQERQENFLLQSSLCAGSHLVSIPSLCYCSGTWKTLVILPKIQVQVAGYT